MNQASWIDKIRITHNVDEMTKLLSGNAFGIHFEFVNSEFLIVNFKPLNDTFLDDTLNSNTGLLFNFERELIEEDDLEYALDIMSLFNQSKRLTIREAVKIIQVENILGMITNEFNHKKASFVMLKALLKVLLLHLIRFQNNEFTSQDLNQKRVYQFLKLMESSFLNETKSEYYADQIGVSEKRLNQILKQKLNLTAKQIIQQRQITEAKRRLIKSDITIKELAFVLGFDSLSSFSRFFKKFVNVNPSKYRLAHSS